MSQRAKARTPPQPLVRRTPKQDRSRRTVTFILEALAALLKERGLTAISTSAIAKKAGVNIGSLYQYFPSSQAVLEALIAHRLSLYESAMVDAFAQADGIPLKDGVAVVVRAHLVGLASDSKLHALLLPHAISAEHGAEYRFLKQRIVKRLERQLRARPLEASPSPDDCATAARTSVDCVAAVSFGALQEGRSDWMDQSNAQQLFRLAQRYLVRGE